MTKQPIDLTLLTAQIQAQDAQSACYVKDMALLNVQAFMLYIAPHVPKHLREEYGHVSEDIEFALKIKGDS